jgi:hypothetical protein
MMSAACGGTIWFQASFRRPYGLMSQQGDDVFDDAFGLTPRAAVANQPSQKSYGESRGSQPLQQSFGVARID